MWELSDNNWRTLCPFLGRRSSPHLFGSSQSHSLLWRWQKGTFQLISHYHIDSDVLHSTSFTNSSLTKWSASTKKSTVISFLSAHLNQLSVVHFVSCLCPATENEFERGQRRQWHDTEDERRDISLPLSGGQRNSTTANRYHQQQRRALKWRRFFTMHVPPSDFI